VELKELTKKTLNMDILYIEDDKHLLQQNRELFKNLFRKVDVTDNGVDAIKLYKSSKYNLVITDINIPLINGINAMKEMKVINPSQLFLVTSVFKQSEWQDELNKLEVKHYLTKPLETKKLLRAIEELVCDFEETTSLCS